MTLFGFPSASGLAHEIDSAAMLDVAVVVEAKDQPFGVDKAQVDVFDGKTLDFFESAVQHGRSEPYYRVIWSTSGIDTLVRRYAARRGMIFVSPERVPLPSLLAACESLDAPEWMADNLLSDFVVLAERACRPLQTNTSSGVFQYVHPLTTWSRSDLEDLEYLHQMASEQWLDWLDRTQPLHFEMLAAEALAQVSGWKEVMRK